MIWMKKAIFTEEEIDLLVTEIRMRGESRYDHRLHVVLLVARNQSCPKVAELLSEPCRTVEYWVRRFKEGGLDGLIDRAPPGRQSRLGTHGLDQLASALRQPPGKSGLKADEWDGQAVQDWIKDRFGISVCTRHAQRLLRRLRDGTRSPS
jgi:transposase